jgi:RHS repeat-associated protein
MSSLDQLFEQFLRERRYLKNVTPSTVEWYQTAWGQFRKAKLDQPAQATDLTRAHLESFVIALRDRGVRPVTCNCWLRALNAFGRWLREREAIPHAITLRQLKVEQRMVKTLDHQAIHQLVSFRPRGFAQWRCYALVATATTSTVTESFAYTLDDRRMLRLVNSTTANYSLIGAGGQTLSEFVGAPGNAGWTKDLVYAGGVLIGAALVSGANEYYGLDALGSVRVVYSDTGAVTGQSEYWPFGIGAATGTMPNQRFTGQERDPAIQLDYFNARMLEPRVGRFTTSDPMFSPSIDPQSWNRYAYVRNNPLVRVDPTGLKDCKPGQNRQYCGEPDQPALRTAETVTVTAKAPVCPLSLATIIGLAFSPSASGNALPGYTGPNMGRMVAQGIAPIGAAQSIVADAKTIISDPSMRRKLMAAGGLAMLAMPLAGEIRLGARAAEIAGLLDKFAQSRRTVAVLETDAGTIVASGGRDLTAAQIGALGEGEIAASPMPGTHAEVTALQSAAEMGATPQGMATSRPICPSCAGQIEASGGTVTGPNTATWPK